MPWNAPNPAPKCPFCEKSVFPAESYMAADRRPFHKQCVKCFDCTKSLVPATINEHQGSLYCHFCYSNKFMPQDDNIPERMAMQVLPVGGIYTAMEEEKRRAEEERIRKDMEEAAKRSGCCPSCGNITVGNDFVELSKDLRVHKYCLKCAGCSKPAEDDLPMLLGPRDTENFFGEEELDPYCKFCFAKKFKVSAMNIADIVNLDATGPSPKSL
eukprot:TRINITY_DN17579_c0_g1_i1.p1 TRINITY_DN17579_c0_g1~~TRINITY_DN17579_c0_g1_i1.p1  ORF type:complete len:228 (-),score=68.03 TRINITY_DN17579_c0_g1_i1:386-1024(-)